MISVLQRRELAYASNRFPVGFAGHLSRAALAIDVGEETRHNRTPWEIGYGHVMLLGLQELVQPVSRGVLVDDDDPDYPPLVDACDAAHAQGGLAIWCHNGKGMEAPVAAALGKLDGFNLFDPYWMDPEWDVWYDLLDCGFVLPASTGSDWFVCSSNRVYVHTGAGAEPPPPAARRPRPPRRRRPPPRPRGHPPAAPRRGAGAAGVPHRARLLLSRLARRPAGRAHLHHQRPRAVAGGRRPGPRRLPGRQRPRRPAGDRALGEPAAPEPGGGRAQRPASSPGGRGPRGSRGGTLNVRVPASPGTATAGSPPAASATPAPATATSSGPTPARSTSERARSPAPRCPPARPPAPPPRASWTASTPPCAGSGARPASGPPSSASAPPACFAPRARPTPASQEQPPHDQRKRRRRHPPRRPLRRRYGVGRTGRAGFRPPERHPPGRADGAVRPLGGQRPLAGARALRPLHPARQRDQRHRGRPPGGPERRPPPPAGHPGGRAHRQPAGLRLAPAPLPAGGG